MSPLASKALLVGIPLLISLSWFLFWVLRITAAARRIKSTLSSGKPVPGAPGAPGAIAGESTDSPDHPPRTPKG
jgi:hypothetical protein